MTLKGGVIWKISQRFLFDRDVSVLFDLFPPNFSVLLDPNGILPEFR